MTREWLLVETLGEQPEVVAQGRQMKNLVPVAAFLRRNPNLAAIQTAITETVATGQALTSITPKTNRVIRTEPVRMSDGRIHGVHVWYGPTDAEPPERPIPGAVIWDLTSGEATDTVESLTNAGLDPDVEPTSGRSVIDDVPSGAFNHDEAKVFALAIDAAPGRSYCTTWEFIDRKGDFRRVGAVGRTAMEAAADGSEHLICRAMNLLIEAGQSEPPPQNLAQRLLEGLAQPGVYRLLVDLKNWTLLKWLDEPCPSVNLRGGTRLHPNDRDKYAAAMTEELARGSTSRVLRLPGSEAEWVPLHVTLSRVELDDGVFAGLVSLRTPSADELAAAGLSTPPEDGND